MAPIAPNITWVMGAIVARHEGAYSQFYPGDDYVDWHALDVYGGVGEESESVFFADIIEPDWSEALSLNPNKPVILVEFGVYVNTKAGLDRCQWFNDFFQVAKTTHIQLGAFIYWQNFNPGEETGASTGIKPDDPCADDWYNEINGPDSSWWHSSIVMESSN